MAKLIKDFGIVECREADPASEEAALEWADWRRNYIGFIGHLRFLESEIKHPGLQFLYFSGSTWKESMQDFWDWNLKTGYGKLSYDGDRVIFCTKNTRYVFERRE